MIKRTEIDVFIFTSIFTISIEVVKWFCMKLNWAIQKSSLGVNDRYFSPKWIQLSVFACSRLLLSFSIISDYNISVIVTVTIDSTDFFYSHYTGNYTQKGITTPTLPSSSLNSNKKTTHNNRISNKTDFNKLSTNVQAHPRRSPLAHQRAPGADSPPLGCVHAIWLATHQHKIM